MSPLLVVADPFDDNQVFPDQIVLSISSYDVHRYFVSLER